jgi:hypothetical protein
LRIERTPGRTTKPHGSPPWALWLIVRDGDGTLEPLCVDGARGRVLPVFCFGDEAELFLRLGGYDAGWHARETGPGELVSVLYGPCKAAKGVAFDPLPEMMEDGPAAFPEVGRNRFVGWLFGRG